MRTEKKFTSFIAIGALLLFVGVATNLGFSSQSAYTKLRLLVDMLEHIQNDYVEEVELQDLVYGAARGMAQTLDPFSQFLPPRDLKEMRTETEGEFGGIGIRVAIGEDGWLTVITPLPGTPAFAAGVLPRDKIIKIDGKPTEGISLEDAVGKLRGKPKTQVVITLSRKKNFDEDDDKAQYTTLDVPLMRDTIKIQTIYSNMIPNTKIGYVRITEFNAQTPKDIHERLGKLAEKGMSGLVLDLRFNPGGLLPSAIETAKEFIGEEKLVVYTQGRQPNSRVEYRAGGSAPYDKIAMAVLINEGSASGSEILAGALQDHKRAVLVGARTFGKASVQSVINLPDGAGLRLTTAYYYTPLGRLIHKKEFKRKKPVEEAEATPEQKAVPPVEVGKVHNDKAQEDDSKWDWSGDQTKEGAKESEGAWGIEPHVKVDVNKEEAMRVYSNFELVYFPDDRPSQPIREVFKKTKKEEGQAKPEKEETPFKDIALDRAVELLKARDLFLSQPN